jgi:hypothetical protein
VTARTRRRAALAAALLAFVAVSVVVARWLSADGAERAAVERLLEAQSRGDAPAMARELARCDAACEARLRGLAARLRGPGTTEIVRYDSGTSHALTSRTRPTRVVWQRRDTLPTVQCVAVQRTGSVLTGPRVRLLDLSAPIGREAGC